MKGKFVVFEGIDGSGKTTLAKRLAAERGGWFTAEPTQSRLGTMLRSGEFGKVPPEAEALLFTADRAVHTEEITRRLDAGQDVFCDRYSGSTVVYQSVSSDGADWDWLCAIQKRASVEPDAVVLLDIDPDASMHRVGARGEEVSRFEDLGFQRRVREAYLRLAEEYGYIVIDASGSVEQVYDRTVDELRKRGINASE